MKNDMVFMGKEIDFEKVVPVFVAVQHYEVDAVWENGESWVNILGMIFREGKKYSVTFRLKFPSEAKQTYSTKKDHLLSNFDEAKEDLLRAGEALSTFTSARLLNEHLHEVPKEAQDAEGFMAFLTASDLFNISQLPAEDK